MALIGNYTVSLLKYLFQHSKSNITSLICALVVCAMTSAKTVLFTLMATDVCHAGDLFKDADWEAIIGFFIIPNGIWIGVPFLCIIKLGSVLINNMENHGKKD